MSRRMVTCQAMKPRKDDVKLMLRKHRILITRFQLFAGLRMPSISKRFLLIHRVVMLKTKHSRLKNQSEILRRHLDEKPQLVIIKRAGHAVNVEKPKQIYKHMKEFLVDPKQESKDDGNKVDDAKKSDYNYIIRITKPCVINMLCTMR
ncbi:hypothetical protein QQ045_029173 [Rhodiola kirilowii]